MSFNNETEPIQTIDQVLYIPATRRQFLRDGLLFLSCLFAAACEEQTPRTPPRPPATAPKLTRLPQIEDGSAKLVEVVESLKPSPIKDFLKERVLRYYQDPKPQFVELAGLKIRVWEARVEIITSNRSDAVLGSFSFRRALTTLPEPLYPARPTFSLIPLVGILLESEANQFPEMLRLADGTPYISSNFSSQAPIFEGVSPRIGIDRPDPKLVKEEDRTFYAESEDVVLIKEACNHLLYEIWIEEIIKKMQAEKFPTHIEVRRRDGSISQAEIVNQALTLLSERRGRLTSLLDLAPYLITFKALEDIALEETLLKDPFMGKVFPSTRNLDLGQTPQDILANSLRWVLTTPDALNLPHTQSDLNRII